MLSTMHYYASWLFAGLFGYVIPFWLWGLVGLAAAAAVFMLLPVAIPERLRAIASSIVLTVGIGLSCGSWGIDQGIHTERMKWSRMIAKETLRLKLEADANLKAEQQRTASAETQSKILQGQLDAIIDNDAPEPTTVNGCSPAAMVPEPTARKLHDLTGRRR